MIESVNEGSVPVEGPRPQPDYAVGFRRNAFSSDQLKKLDPFLGSVWDTSLFVATYRMYFPFLTCELKCGDAAFNIADRQNAHSMTLAVRSVVELFKLVKREQDLHREILAFSVSHDHSSVRIFGPYAIIEENKTTFYRHPIRAFVFTDQEGKDKWSAYRFTINVYNKWMPAHLERLRSAVDRIPSGVSFDVSEQVSSWQSNPESLTSQAEDNSIVGSQGTTPRTSFTQDPQRQTKKPKS